MATIFPSSSAGAKVRRVAVIGAGPIGLEAAVASAEHGFDVKVFELGNVAEHVRRWGHVVLFTPFGMNRSDRGVKAILADRPDRRLPPDDALLSGRDFAEQYLLPLAECSILKGRVHTGQRITAVGRTGLLKHEGIGDSRRAESPMRLLIESEGNERIVEADIVIDASGTYSRPNRLGDGGIPAVGERAAAGRISYELDDVLGIHRGRYEGKRTVLIGSGYSAATSIVALRKLVDEHPATQVVWLTRRASGPPVHEIPGDRLPARQALARQANRIAGEEHPRIRHVSLGRGSRVEQTATGDLIVHVRCRSREMRFEADRILANIGYQPDRSIYEQLQVHECYATAAPMKLAASLLGESAADCLDRKPAPTETLMNPEPGFFILGSKSYGRDSTFLMKNGLAQVEQLFTHLFDERNRREKA